MSTTTSTLPAGWATILEEMQKRLDQIVTLADARITQFPHAEVDVQGQGRRAEIGNWDERLKRLSGYLESAEQVVQNVDAMLQQEEGNLRQQVAASGALRQKLAEGSRRAIG